MEIVNIGKNVLKIFFGGPEKIKDEVTAVSDLIRIANNKAGHPVTLEEARQFVQYAPSLLEDIGEKGFQEAFKMANSHEVNTQIIPVDS